ncbi:MULTISPECIES: teichoic acids export ABC transporter ATP-binding subunit TagH [unclassified Exiguobacterium]|uniref:teichoic acids export ABC transporter ATP-binding subunit TagH n=1 Tax=unclassified Exiguobacterium TaxID=2644629 RepID=UPI00103EF390|nr:MULTISPECIES: teichoic acids export ABC transporter ATP-binding subunit TagH [unclassified Exiguobacterium]TCI52835.1 teichoic acids export ABC transporter ATP-binding subunit TagH [Exiguobacterium sp. SH5S13]TCI63990.1 teichoic acids export ABC transporter ATP-binding subunit TagH [Exiguobacterium sp. SH3S1]
MSYQVKFENVSKRYTLYRKQSDKLKEVLFNRANGKQFYALRNVTFEVPPGEVVGILGINGSGKSTMSNLLSDVIPPTHGKIELRGKPSLIAISSGLNGNLTGMENIELKCLMLGMDKHQIRAITPGIIEFADIGDFIDQPVKTYSSGMKARLGFAISININPDILVIDEALSVGDQTFTDRCLVKMNEFKDEGKTIFFISHSVSQVRQFCTQAIWLEYGEIREYGLVDDVADEYMKFLKWFRTLDSKRQSEFKQQKMEQRTTIVDQNDIGETIILPRHPRKGESL